MVTSREQSNEEARRERLAEGLTDVYPDLTILDDALEVGGGRIVDLVGVDGRGRLVLVQRVGETDEPALFGLVSAAAFAQANRDLLVNHLGAVRTTTSPPLAVLVAEHVTPAFVECLNVLRPDLVRVFEECSIASARAGRKAYLRSVYPPAPLDRPQPIPDVARFVRALPVDLRPRADELVRRIARIDDEAECVVSEKAVTWTLEGRLLGTVLFEDGHLVGRVPPSSQTVRLTGRRECEDFLAQVLQRCVGLIGPERPAGNPGDEDDDELGDEPTPGGLSPHPSAILTAEEIRAFHE